MTDDIIGMDDMMAFYEVTDRFGIDRESISVPLERQGDGVVRREAGGSLEILAPATIPTREWLPSLDAELKRLGFEPADDDDDAWPD